MGVALEAGLDLGALAGCFLLIAILACVGYTFERLAGALNVSILGVRPFKSVAKAINATIVDGCNDGIKALEKAAASFESGLIDSFGLILGLPILLYLGVKAALDYLWSSALKPLIHSITDAIRRTANEALAESVGVAQGLATGLASVEHDALAAVSAAETAAKRYAEGLVHGVALDLGRGIDELRGSLERELYKGIDEVRGTALSAVNTLQRAEDAAIGAATAGIGSVAGELHDLERSLPLGDITSMVAAVPAIAAAVAVLELETGLDNPGCRGKVKGICGTDPLAWAGLLAGAAFMAGDLSLADLIVPARGIFHAAEGLIREAA